MSRRNKQANKSGKFELTEEQKQEIREAFDLFIVKPSCMLFWPPGGHFGAAVVDVVVGAAVVAGAAVVVGTEWSAERPWWLVRQSSWAPRLWWSWGHTWRCKLA
jgi:hypothetical protein